jgi:hypothetical protein
MEGGGVAFESPSPKNITLCLHFFSSIPLEPTVTILHAQGFVLVTLNVEKAYFKDLFLVKD